jgi:hypothetical protein
MHHLSCRSRKRRAQMSFFSAVVPVKDEHRWDLSGETTHTIYTSPLLFYHSSCTQLPLRGLATGRMFPAVQYTMHLEFPEARQVAGRPAAPSRRCKFAIALLFPTPDHLRDELGHSESATTAGSRSKQIWPDFIAAVVFSSPAEAQRTSRNSKAPLAGLTLLCAPTYQPLLS